MTFRFVTAIQFDRVQVLVIVLAVVVVTCGCCCYTLCRKGDPSIEPDDWTNDKKVESHV